MILVIKGEIYLKDTYFSPLQLSPKVSKSTFYRAGSSITLMIAKIFFILSKTIIEKLNVEELFYKTERREIILTTLLEERVQTARMD